MSVLYLHQGLAREFWHFKIRNIENYCSTLQPLEHHISPSMVSSDIIITQHVIAFFLAHLNPALGAPAYHFQLPALLPYSANLRALLAAVRVALLYLCILLHLPATRQVMVSAVRFSIFFLFA